MLRVSEVAGASHVLPQLVLRYRQVDQTARTVQSA